jgi:hypothetical protein
MSTKADEIKYLEDKLSSITGELHNMMSTVAPVAQKVAEAMSCISQLLELKKPYKSPLRYPEGGRRIQDLQPINASDLLEKYPLPRNYREWVLQHEGKTIASGTIKPIPELGSEYVIGCGHKVKLPPPYKVEKPNDALVEELRAFSWPNEPLNKNVVEAMRSDRESRDFEREYLQKPAPAAWKPPYKVECLFEHYFGDSKEAMAGRVFYSPYSDEWIVEMYSTGVIATSKNADAVRDIWKTHEFFAKRTLPKGFKNTDALEAAGRHIRKIGYHLREEYWRDFHAKRIDKMVADDVQNELGSYATERPYSPTFASSLEEMYGPFAEIAGRITQHIPITLEDTKFILLNRNTKYFDAIVSMVNASQF